MKSYASRSSSSSPGSLDASASRARPSVRSAERRAKRREPVARARRQHVNELPEPPVVRSVNGVAHVSLFVVLNGATGFPSRL